MKFSHLCVLQRKNIKSKPICFEESAYIMHFLSFMVNVFVLNIDMLYLNLHSNKWTDETKIKWPNRRDRGGGGNLYKFPLISGNSKITLKSSF